MSVAHAQEGEFVVFGPQDYLRAKGLPVKVVNTFSVLNPNTEFIVHIYNGGLEDTSEEFVSSSIISLNGVEILGPNNFNQQVRLINVPVTLQASNTIEVEVRGAPGGLLTVVIAGKDTTPPVISDPMPADGAVVNEARPSVSAAYSDELSGIDISAVKITVDDADVTSGATVASDGVIYVPDFNLTEGNHTVQVDVKDKAGNAQGLQWAFTVASTDSIAPDISISPLDGTVLSQTKPLITVSYADDDSGIDPASFYAEINGVDSTGLFTVDDSHAEYPPASDLPIGDNTVKARIKDEAGNTAEAVSNFSIAVLRAIPDANPVSGYAPLTVNFKTGGEDPCGTIEIFRWDFDGNGTWDTYDTVARDYPHTYNTPGNYAATLYVKSSTGETATAAIDITVQNNPPVAQAMAIPSNGPVPLEVQLAGSGSDKDGTIVLYEWDFEGDGVYDWSSASTGTTTYTYTSEGTYQALFRVTDNNGLTATAQAVTTAVRVGPPGSPSVTASVTPDSGDAPLTVTFNGTAVDPDNDIVLYEWDYDGDGVFDWSSDTMSDTTYTYTTAGSHIATLKVTDASGLTAIDQRIITVNIKVSLALSNNTVGFLQNNFINHCLQSGVAVNASSVYGSWYPASNVIDGNPETYWFSIYGDTPGQGQQTFIEVTFPSPQTVSHIILDGGYYWTYYGITQGRLELFDAAGALLYSGEKAFPAPCTEISITETCNVVRCRLTALATNAYYYYTCLGEFGIGQIPTGDIEPSGTNITTSISASTFVSLFIKDTDGNIIRTLINNTFREMGTYNDYWDCKDDLGFVVNDGLYYAVLSYLFEGDWQDLDLTYSTGGARYSYPFGTGCNTRDSFNASFSPFENDLLPLTFRLCTAQEVTAFIGPLWGGTDETRVRTIVNRKAFPAGTNTIYWDGLDDQGNVAKAPPGDNLITGFWRYDLPVNAIYMTGCSPEITDISADNNYFSPFSEKCASDGIGEAINISYTVSKDVHEVELRIYSVSTSALVRTIRKYNVSAGEHSVLWNGKNNNGEYVAIGDYRVGIIGRDAQGNESLLRYILVRLDY